MEVAMGLLDTVHHAVHALGYVLCILLIADHQKGGASLIIYNLELV